MDPIMVIMYHIIKSVVIFYLHLQMCISLCIRSNMPIPLNKPCLCN